MAKNDNLPKPDAEHGHEPGRDRPPPVLLTRSVNGDLLGPSFDGSAGSSQPGALAPMVTRALQDVLGWKINADDSKGFVNALNRSVELQDFEGHVRYKWVQRGVAVQDDLSGGVAGAQASIYTMARTMLDQTLPLLEDLHALRPDDDEEYIEVARELVSKQLTELVAELGSPGGPLVMRVNQYFYMLTGTHIDIKGGADLRRLDPDEVNGTLGALRRQMGLRAVRHKDNTEKCYVNNVEDEQNVTNFRVIVDYVYAILNAWLGSLHFFMSLTPDNKCANFLGTELVWISRQLSVVSEVVDEIRFLLDSDLVGPGERETLWLDQLTFTEPGKTEVMHLPGVTLESLLSWIQNFVRNEAPDVIRNGGRYGIGVNFARMVSELKIYAAAVVVRAPHIHQLKSDRLRPSLCKLEEQLRQLEQRAAAVGDEHLLT